MDIPDQDSLWSSSTSVVHNKSCDAQSSNTDQYLNHLRLLSYSLHPAVTSEVIWSVTTFCAQNIEDKELSSFFG